MVESIRDQFDNMTVDDIIDSCAKRIHRSKASLTPHFINLQSFTLTDDELRLGLHRDAFRNIVADLLRNNVLITPDEKLCYLLGQLSLTPIAQAQRPDPYEQSLRQNLVEAFHHQYRGDAHRRFLEFVIKVNQTLFESKPAKHQPYYKGTAVIQSSGTGKTRMILELGRIAPLLFMCIRPQTGTARTGYPLGDTAIMNLVQSNFMPDEANQHNRSNTISNDEKAAILLAAWFHTLASKLEQQSHPKPKFDLLVELNTFGTCHRHNQRQLFFQQVQTQATTWAKDAPIADDYNTIFSHYLNPQVHRLSHQMHLIHEYLAAIHADTRRSTPVFVALDKCVELPPGLLDSIERAWAHLKQLENSQHAERQASKAKDKDQPKIVCFWLVLISTNSSAAHLIRPQPEHTLTRDKNAIPLPTFCGVGFDVLRVELPPLVMAQDAATTHFVQKHGRPLWISLVPENFWVIAVSKVLGTTNFVRGHRTICFNVLASRLALQYVPTRGSDNRLFGEQATFARNTVDRHMRILDCVDGDAILHVSSPSEPVLAIASSLSMMPTHTESLADVPVPLQTAVNRYGSILETVADTCLGSADIDILKGIRGELMVRLLLMTAWDAVKMSVERSHFADSEDLSAKATRFLAPVHLKSILQGLVRFDPTTWRTVQGQIDAVCQLVCQRWPSMTNTNVRAWVHFTHFDILDVKLGQLSPEYLWYCWKRGVAIQMAHPQHGIDGIIPVFVGDLEQPFDQNHVQEHHGLESEAQADSDTLGARLMTYVAWEAKNRRKTSPDLAYQAAQKPAHAGPMLKFEASSQPAQTGGSTLKRRRSTTEPDDVAPLTDRGILTILADVGAKTKPGGVQRIKDTGSLQLWIRGLDPPNYPCLDELEIRSAVIKFGNDVVQRADYDVYNRMPNPMDLDVVHVSDIDLTATSAPDSAAVTDHNQDGERLSSSSSLSLQVEDEEMLTS
ncbi:uncharacterized protein UTRI_06482 [Ustilago trichophora]|uniref:Uncharacterized protein n=1 Tax=Ustilago trichophora TaxID=86804 RepID=A0A5C3EJC7_9BASI|nr:uncharacterized protein UTRI_06482 [Ustilago trichophora]